MASTRTLSEIPSATVTEAIDRLTELLCPPDMLDAAARQLETKRWEEKIGLLVMGWPSLAAALGQLLEENGVRAPMAIKRAYQILAKEDR